MSSFNSNPRKDAASNYIHLQGPKDTNAITCNNCSKVMKGCIHHAKQHLVVGYRNILGCKKVPKPITEEIRGHMLKERSNEAS